MPADASEPKALAVRERKRRSASAALLEAGWRMRWPILGTMIPASVFLMLFSGSPLAGIVGMFMGTGVGVWLCRAKLHAIETRKAKPAAALDHVGFELRRIIDGAGLLRARLGCEGDLDDVRYELWTWLREVDGLDVVDRGRLRQLGLSLSQVRAAVRGELETPDAGPIVADELAGFVAALAEPDGDVYR